MIRGLKSFNLFLILCFNTFLFSSVQAQEVYGPGGLIKPMGKPSVTTNSGVGHTSGGPFVLSNSASDQAANTGNTGAPKISGKSTWTDLAGIGLNTACGKVGGFRIGGGCTGLGAGPAFQGGAFQNDVVDQTSCAILGIPQGSFGAMAMVIAGIIAVCGAMLGSYRMALNTILVGGGAWAIQPLVTLFWGEIC